MTISGKGAVLVTALLLGGMGNALAQDSGSASLEPMRIVAGTPAFTLENGSSPSHMLPGTDHYRFDVASASNLRVISEQWSPEGVTAKLRATLRDARGRIVARSRSDGGDFVLGHRVAPGSYTLEVSSSRLNGAWNRGAQHYRVMTDGLRDRGMAHQRHESGPRQEFASIGQYQY